MIAMGSNQPLLLDPPLCEEEACDDTVPLACELCIGPAACDELGFDTVLLLIGFEVTVAEFTDEAASDDTSEDTTDDIGADEDGVCEDTGLEEAGGSDDTSAGSSDCVMLI